MTRRVLLLLLLLAVPLAAQTSTPPPLTEVETLRVQNLALKRSILERQLQDYNAEVALLKADLEKSRAGWTWNSDTGKWAAQEPAK